jgi:hypothetical protein
LNNPLLIMAGVFAMKITLQPITSDNWIGCIALRPADEQVRIGFVAPDSLSQAQAHYEPWW